MKKYEIVEVKLFYLDNEDVITKSDSDFSANSNDNDVNNGSGFIPY